MKKEEIMVPTNDYVFKRLFGHVGNEEITKGLIKAVLKRNIESVTLDETPILEKDLQDDKVGILDIRARLYGNKMCNIEMQVVQEDSIDKRIMFYWSKLYASEIHEGESYKVLNKTIAILIANFELKSIKEIAKYHTKWEIREEECSKVVLTNVFELHIIEIPKLINQLDKGLISKEDELSAWIRFINNPEKVGEADMDNNKELKQAKDELDKMKQDERERYLAYLREKHIRDTKAIREFGYNEGKERGLEEGKAEGLAKGRAEGRAEGIQEGKKKEKAIVINMHKRKMSIEDICEIVSLNKEEVEKIIMENE